MADDLLVGVSSPELSSQFCTNCAHLHLDHLDIPQDCNVSMDRPELLVFLLGLPKTKI